MRILYFGSYCLPLIILMTIFTLSSQDATTSAALSESVTELVNTLVSDTLATTASTPAYYLTHGEIRALAHIGLFCLFGMSCMFALSLHPKTHTYRIIITFLLSLICAITDEIIQLNSPGRAYELIDIAKDMLGACIGIACIWVALRLWDCVIDIRF